VVAVERQVACVRGRWCGAGNGRMDDLACVTWVASARVRAGDGDARKRKTMEKIERTVFSVMDGPQPNSMRRYRSYVLQSTS